jgi:hypothetical protein
MANTRRTLLEARLALVRRDLDPIVEPQGYEEIPSTAAGLHR